ncbi:Homocysteine S-methyltransferase [Tribonema minus]|uniref:Homocysteine S-methyltransferase n=1 Tax=Tribonema minus TaxID=303371 RepID=A0A835ZCV0_9STRA|nr:Homocysteine S-methyltransferase [Tribonema minus]
MTLYRSSIHTVFASETLLAEGGLETTLVFGPKPRELPQFAAFPILDNDDDRAMLLDYYREFFAVAKKHGVSIQMDTVTWRASSKWGALLGQECQTNRNKIIISGAIGPRGDGYIPGDLMTPEEAKRYHTAQIATFASTPVDIVTAYTLSYVEEGIGIALAAAEIGVPVFINFTVETNGLLPSGMPLPDAISVIDAVCDAFVPDSAAVPVQQILPVDIIVINTACRKGTVLVAEPVPVSAAVPLQQTLTVNITVISAVCAFFGAGSRPVGYGINCAHPTHFAHVLEAGAAVDAPWLRRFTALRANASAKSHAELDEVRFENFCECCSRCTRCAPRPAKAVHVNGMAVLGTDALPDVRPWRSRAAAVVWPVRCGQMPCCRGGGGG